MKIDAGFIGTENVLRNIKGAERKIGLAVARGLKKAGLLLQREAQLKVPVNFGILKASAFTRAEGEAVKTVVNVGFTAGYAIYVHENREIWPPGMRLKGQPRMGGSVDSAGRVRDTKGGQFRKGGRYWDPQGKAQPKFLEEPFREFGPTLRQVVGDEIKKIL